MTTRIMFLLGISLALACTGAARADDWPQWRGPRRDGVWRESGVVQRLPSQLDVRWRTPIGGGFAGPAVADGRVFVCDRVVPADEDVPDSRWDRTDPVRGSERVLCLDAATGRTVWTHEYACRYTLSYPAGPRATPTVDDDRVYTVGAMGDLKCLAADTGRVLWAKNFVEDFGTQMNPWGMASAPLVDGQRLIVLCGGADGGCVQALDKHTGEEIWRALDAVDPGYSSPVIIESGGVRQLIVWNPVELYGLDPASGAVYWHHPLATKMGHSIATPVFDATSNRVFVSSFFAGPLMLQLGDDKPSARVLWRGDSQSELPGRTDKLHVLMSTPALVGDHLYGVGGYGHLRCLEAATGRRVWETLDATGEARWSNAFMIRHEDRFFLFNEHGQLITAELSPAGYRETSRAQLIEPTQRARRRDIVWSHPAFANRSVYARNDKAIVCVDLAGPY